MSGYSTAIKVMSIIAIVFGALLALFGVLLILLAGTDAFVGQMITLDDESFSWSSLLPILGGISIGMAALYIVNGILGVRAANDPTKGTPFVVFCIVNAVCAAIGVVSSIANGSVSSIISGLIGVAIPVLLIFFSRKALEAAQSQA